MNIPILPIPPGLPGTAHQALLDQIGQYRLLCNNVPVAMAYFEHPSNTCSYANQGYAQLFGHTEASILGLTVVQVIGEEAARFIQPQVDRVVLDGVPATYERQLTGADGQTRHVEVHLLPHIRQPEPNASGAFVLISDITRHRRAEAALRESEDRLAKFMHASAEGIAFHKGGITTDVNPPLLALLGYTLPQMLGRPTLDFVAPDQRANVAAVIAAGPEISYDSAVLHRDGTRIPVEFIVRTMHYQGEPLRMTIVRDIRDRLEAQARIHHMAHHDELTGLPNRTAFNERAMALLAQAAAGGQGLALLFIDLDHFKEVNDTLGHDWGDTLLVEAARRIQNCLREVDTVARMGGDEFTVIITELTDAAHLHHILPKLLQTLSNSFQLGLDQVFVSASIGVTVSPTDGTEIENLLKNADQALYVAKGAGRNRFSFFTPAMQQVAQLRAQLTYDMRLALVAQEFRVVYQPIVELATGAIRKAEVLVRWQHPTRGLISPAEFIPVAESSGLIVALGEWVFAQAAVQVRAWRERFHPQFQISVNKSPIQFENPNPAHRPWIEQLQELGLGGDSIAVEITEGLLLSTSDGVAEQLLELSDVGINVSLDDFGTGYSSLSYLQRFDIDFIKIDQSFVRHLVADSTDLALCQAIIAMAHALGMKVVAEGVETELQRDLLTASGCDFGQGYLFSRPVPAADFEALMFSVASSTPEKNHI
jgi:diguanylate cyclase (GGDEF)-like protein/PAS domain S-box-containing protein